MQTGASSLVATPCGTELRRRAQRAAPGGGGASARPDGPELVVDCASGSHLIDVNGVDYVDYLLGDGPNLLGHAPAAVLDAVERACRRGLVYGAQHELEAAAAEAVLDAVGWADSVRLASTGTEAVQVALRVARAVTGRSMFVRFAGHEHGWLDNVLVSADPECCDQHVASAGQLSSHLDDSVMVPWNDLDLLSDVLEDHHRDIAAVIAEPAMLHAGAIEPAPGFLSGLRSLCDRYGIALVFDEVSTGFRLALGGGAERYGVTPDLATYGKALGGGWPVAAIAGSDRCLRGLDTGVIAHGGTFNASTMACAAVVATIGQLTDDPPYPDMERRGTRLQTGLRALAADHGLALHVNGPAAAFHVGFGSGPLVDHSSLAEFDRTAYRAFARALVAHGVCVSGRGLWYLSAVHTDDDIDETLRRVDAAMVACISPRM